MAGPPTIEQERFRLLLTQLLQEGVPDGVDLGPQDFLAERTGVSQSMISYVLAGTREIGVRGLNIAIDRMRIDRRFFTDRSLRNPDYRDFIGKVDESRIEKAKRYPAFENVLSYYPAAKDLTEEDIAEIDGLDFGGLSFKLDEEFFEGLVRRAAARRKGKALESKGEPAKTTLRAGRVKLHERKRR